MMTFLWMAIWGIVIMVCSTIAISLMSRAFMNRFPGTTPIYFISGVILTLAALIISLTVSFQLSFSFLSLLLLFIGSWLLLWGELKLQGIRKEVLSFAVCLATPCLLPQNTIIFQQLPFFLAVPLLGASLYLMMRVFSLMDKVSNLSLLTLLTQGILLSLLFRGGEASDVILHAMFYAFVVIISVSQTTKAFTGIARLGDYAASVSGFAIGFLLIYIMANGFYFTPLILFSYDIMELLIAGGITLVATHRVYPFACPFLIEKAQQNSPNTKKINRFLFLILLMSAMVSYLLFQENPANGKAFALQGIILLCTVYYLKNWGIPLPAFRDLTSDLKKGFSELKEQVNHIPLKQDKLVRQDKPVKQKKTTSRPSTKKRSHKK